MAFFNKGDTLGELSTDFYFCVCVSLSVFSFELVSGNEGGYIGAMGGGRGSYIVVIKNNEKQM